MSNVLSLVKYEQNDLIPCYFIALCQVRKEFILLYILRYILSPDTRLAVVDSVGGDTGVKTQHRLRLLATIIGPSWSHRPSPSFRFFFLNNTNNLVQLENRHYN